MMKFEVESLKCLDYTPSSFLLMLSVPWLSNRCYLRANTQCEYFGKHYLAIKNGQNSSHEDLLLSFFQKSYLFLLTIIQYFAQDRLER